MSDRYHQPEEGTADWHVPLNRNFADLGVEVLGEVETVGDLPAPDPDATSNNGVPRRVLVRENRTLYRDDGDEWQPVAGLGTASDPIAATASLSAVAVEEHVRAPAVRTSQLDTADGERALQILPPDDATAGPNLIGGHVGNDVVSTAVGSTIGGGGTADLANTVLASFGTIGGGRGNTVTSENATVGGGTENAARDEAATVAGGAENTAAGTHAAIGGGFDNDAAAWGVVGGGFRNEAGPYAAVAGGCHNTAVEYYATVAGGDRNTATRTGATVGGGEHNDATAEYGTVGGGHENAADGTCAAIGGGDANTANGHCATIPGGTANTATGKSSFAAGHRANATDDGAFVWADSHDHDVDSWGENTWSARTTGGARFVTGIDDGGDPASGVHLPAGSGSWETLSASDVKSNAEPVDPQRVLAGVEALTINTWEYDAEADDTTHMGPMAEDFHAAFDLGGNEESIATVDADGVAFGAIQGLAERTDDHADAIDDQRETVEDLRAENRAYRRRLTAIEAENDELRAEVETLREKYADLAERVADLEAEPVTPE